MKLKERHRSVHFHLILQNMIFLVSPLTFLTNEGTMVGFPTPESLVSIERLAVAELALDNALSGRMEGMHILQAGFVLLDLASSS